MTLIVIVLLYFAHKHTNERFSLNSLVGIPLYILFYSVLASLALLSVFVDLIRGKKNFKQWLTEK
ncbi:hypothetical protein HYU23_03390, partial [Candidatus Woesearchaeota archaeon]|nr:hypothetical protein [Candidatus Woesearchaeota archaeon]